MAKNITKSVTIGTIPVNVATALGLGLNVGGSELILQTDSINVYFGGADLSAENGMRLTEFTERQAGNEPIQIGDTWLVSLYPDDRVNIRVRI